MISADKAREILGEKAKSLTDKQIGIILASLYRLAEMVADQVTKMPTSERKIRIEKLSEK